MGSTAADLTGIAMAAGRLAGGWAMASAPCRYAAAVRQLGAVWTAFRRDAGAGDVGREHQSDGGGLLATADPRRDGVLLWLVDHAGPELSRAAAFVSRCVGATRRFDRVAAELLAVAIDTVPDLPERTSPEDVDAWLWSYIDCLGRDADFEERQGEAASLVVDGTRLLTYRPANPGGCWAANLALAARAPRIAMAIPPGTLSRQLFRIELERKERAAYLRQAWLDGLERDGSTLVEIDRDLRRGGLALAHLSSNARARLAWTFVAGTGGLTRTQLARGLNLSRGGAHLISQHLVAAGLVTLGADGIIAPAEVRADQTATELDDGLVAAAGAVDQAMADLDRLLARLSD